jgi:molecular chaperone DnaJ
MKNYYEILGVNENSSQDEIKKAYKKLSKQFHPDVNPEGEDRFKEISEAYENIGEESKRQTYDQKRNNPFGNFTNGFDIHSMFEQMMNGGPRQAPKAPDKVLDVVVSPVESYLGTKKELKYTFYNICKPCNGEGGDKKRCQVCNGSGVIIQVFGTGMFNHRIQTQCHGCNGKGSIIENMCKSCSGNGVVVETENLTVSLPKNIDNGDFMRLKNRGDFNTNVKQRGDLILKVTLDNTGLFEKSGSDLIYKKKMTSVELIINEFIDVEHPDGNLKLTKPDMLDTDKPLRVINKGYNINGATGNFYIKISVTNDKKSKESLLQMMNSTK